MSFSLVAQALLQLVGGAKPKPVVSVDMQAELKKLGLAEHFPIAVRPPTDAVTQLAVWIKAAKKHKGEKAYVFVDLKRFLPAKCPAHLTSDAAEEDVGDNSNANCALAAHFEAAAAKAKARKLDFGYWQVSWRGYSLAAAATGQMTFGPTTSTVDAKRTHCQHAQYT